MFKSQPKSVGLRQNPRYQKPKTHKTVPTCKEKAPNGGRLGNRAKKQEVGGETRAYTQKRSVGEG